MVNFSNLLDFEETGVRGILSVAEVEYGLKIEEAPVLGALGPIFGRNFGISRERWVVQARGQLHRVSRRILHMDAAL